VPGGTGGDVLNRSWADEGFPAVDERPGDFSTGLPILRFMTAALRRGAWLWCATAALGLLIGLGFGVVAPPADEAATSVLLTHSPDERPSDAVLTDIAMAHSRPVAVRAIRALGLRESATGFLAAYTVTSDTDRVLLITFGAPSVSEAEARANAVAAAFLQFRARELRAQQPMVLADLNRRIGVAQRQAESLATEIAKLSVHARSHAQKVGLARLKARGRRANNALSGLELTASAYQVATASAVADSQVLDRAAPITHTRRSLSPGELDAVLFAATGFIPGLALGVGFVIVRALTSDRLRRREDVARALGAPVRLSVGKVHRGGPFRRRGLAAAQGRDLQHIVAHLGAVLPPGSGGAIALAVVAVDDVDVAALSVASLAVSCANEGKRVVLADLCRGARAARLIGVRDPGVHPVDVNGARLVAVVPGAGSAASVGPLPGSLASSEPPAAELATACAGADLVLTLAQLDPSLGGELLATWASDVVLTVTTGRSSWTTIHAAGEMVRNAGLRLVSTLLVASDKSDESLGVAHGPARTDVLAHGVPPL
jgi:capsular polysaccharide biosynthesis protein